MRCFSFSYHLPTTIYLSKNMMFKFVMKYIKHECLWNIKCLPYKNKHTERCACNKSLSMSVMHPVARKYKTVCSFVFTGIALLEYHYVEVVVAFFKQKIKIAFRHF